jgi:hypothetical protein
MFVYFLLKKNQQKITLKNRQKAANKIKKLDDTTTG